MCGKIINRQNMLYSSNITCFKVFKRGGIVMLDGLPLMTYDDYEELLNGPKGHYYIGRWEYFKEVLKVIQNEKVKSVIELGPGLLPIVKNSDVIMNPEEDHFGRPNEINGEVLTFDATTKNWPISDKQYDLFIALQVWEHLDNKQGRAFREVMRISKMAILSFPYHWEGGEENPMHRAHRLIDRETIEDWTLNIKPEKVIEILRTGPEFAQGPRIIYFWKF
jgi:hypothetical protein